MHRQKAGNTRERKLYERTGSLNGCRACRVLATLTSICTWICFHPSKHLSSASTRGTGRQLIWIRISKSLYYIFNIRVIAKLWQFIVIGSSFALDLGQCVMRRSVWILKFVGPHTHAKCIRKLYSIFQRNSLQQADWKYEYPRRNSISINAIRLAWTIWSSFSLQVHK